MTVAIKAIDLLIEAGITGEPLKRIVQSMTADINRVMDWERRRFRPSRVNAERQLRYRRRLSITATEWKIRREAVFIRDNYICQYCAFSVVHRPICDHYIPLVLGGSDEIDNLKTCCKPCNSSKGGKHPDSWRGLQ